MAVTSESVESDRIQLTENRLHNLRIPAQG